MITTLRHQQNTVNSMFAKACSYTSCKFRGKRINGGHFPLLLDMGFAWRKDIRKNKVSRTLKRSLKGLNISIAIKYLKNK